MHPYTSFPSIEINLSFKNVCSHTDTYNALRQTEVVAGPAHYAGALVRTLTHPPSPAVSHCPSLQTSSDGPAAPKECLLHFFP